MTPYATKDYLNLWGPDCFNLRLMLKILHAGCLGLPPVISAQITLEMYDAA